MYKISEFIYSYVQFTQSVYCTENNLDRYKPIEVKFEGTVCTSRAW